MSAHTPGPWKVDGSTARGEWATVIGSRGERVAVLYETEAAGAETANGRLIAVAPDMLEELKGARAELAAVERDARDEAERGHDSFVILADGLSQRIRRIDALLARAEGRS